jgi:hypothetical protein
MYSFLRDHLPARLANILIIIWYTLLTLACFYGLSKELGEFRYADW